MEPESTSSPVTPDAQGQVVVQDGKRYAAFKEGLATILVPQRDVEATKDQKPSSAGDAERQQVFYNPIQQFNRDLTVLAITAYGQELVERRKTDFEARLAKYAEKKRKRKDKALPEAPPSKAAKHESGDTIGQSIGFTTRTLEAPTNSAKELDSPASGPAKQPQGGPDARVQEQPQVVDARNDDTTSNNGPPPARNLDDEDDTKVDGAAFTILDALSATGLRALRYAREVPFATSVTAVDMLKSAVEAIRMNVSYNGLTDKVHAVQDDAIAHMYTLVSRELRRPKGQHPHRQKSEKYDVIDLDPYGSAAPFFDAAIQAVRNDGGLLCVTCTDTGVWASNGYPEKAFSLYGGVTMKGVHSHEAGLRLILHALATSGARSGLTIEPLLSLSIDFYGRMFVRIRRSPAAVKFHASRTMIVYNCDAGCGAWRTQHLLKNKCLVNKSGSGTFYKHSFATGPTSDLLCEHCGSKMHVAGPMYAGPLHTPAFVKQVLHQLSTAAPNTYGTSQRIEGVLTTALEETELYTEQEDLAQGSATAAVAEVEPGQQGEDKAAVKSTVAAHSFSEAEAAAIDPSPFFFVPSQVASVLRCDTPSESALRGALVGLGYRVTRSHCKPGSMKTDAPWSVIWQVMREWVRQKAPVKEEHIKPGTAAYKILGLDRNAQGDGSAAGENRGGTGENGALEEAHISVVFDEKRGRYPERKLVRYQLNPRENWGPMTRAKGR